MRFKALLLCQKCRWPCSYFAEQPIAHVKEAGDVVAIAVGRDVEVYTGYIVKK